MVTSNWVTDTFRQIIGRYALFDEIAAGGMATVHIGRLLGPVGFSRTVAIKRLHPQFAKDPEFVSMFVDEARVAARIRHPNVVPTLDVVRTEDELFLVMEYVQGESLSRLLRQLRRQKRTMDPRIVVPVLVGVLQGLHAAHNAKGERGELLHIVHRDVSPQNVLVGTDGVPRVFDFGIAKARGRLQTTREGQIKGKLAYMSPEQMSGEEVGPQTDIYAASVVAWEALAGRRLFEADNEALLLGRVLSGASEPPSAHNPEVCAQLDELIMKGLALDPAERFASAREMAVKLEAVVRGATSTEIGEWVEEMATEMLRRRADRIAEIESQSEIKALNKDLISPATMGSDRNDEPSRPSSSGTQLSTISVSRPGHIEGERRNWSMMAVLLVLLLGGGAAAFVLMGGDANRTNAAPGPPTAAVPSVTQSAVPSALTAAPSQLASGPRPTTSAAQTAPSPPPRGDRVVAPPPEPTATAAPPPPPPPPPPRPNCDPPYTWDDVRKIKIPKAGCL